MKCHLIEKVDQVITKCEITYDNAVDTIKIAIMFENRDNFEKVCRDIKLKCVEVVKQTVLEDLSKLLKLWSQYDTPDDESSMAYLTRQIAKKKEVDEWKKKCRSVGILC